MIDSRWLETGFLLQDEKEFYCFTGPFERSCEPPESDSKEHCFYAPYFNGSAKPFYYSKHFFKIRPVDLKQALQQLLQQEVSQISRTEETQKWTELEVMKPANFTLFEKQFTHFKNHLNILDKVVPVSFETYHGSISKLEKIYYLYQLLCQNRKWVYGFWDQEGGVLGLTPEYLFRKTHNQIDTMALAGTAPVDREGFMDDPKEIKEHEVVVKDIQRQFLGEEQNTSNRYEYPFGKVKHQRTDIQIKSKESRSFVDTARKLHPTAAMAGFPREEALRWLSGWYFEQRRHFGAPFGILKPNGDGFCLVAIRNIQWDKKSKFIGAGCGLVSSSNLEREWKELELKRKSVIDSLLLSLRKSK